jgi:hypothetical protein
MARPKGKQRRGRDDETSAEATSMDAGALAGVARADLPAMLAQAKRDGDADLIAAILKACSE